MGDACGRHRVGRRERTRRGVEQLGALKRRVVAVLAAGHEDLAGREERRGLAPPRRPHRACRGEGTGCWVEDLGRREDVRRVLTTGNQYLSLIHISEPTRPY